MTVLSNESTSLVCRKPGPPRVNAGSGSNYFGGPCLHGHPWQDRNSPISRAITVRYVAFYKLLGSEAPMYADCMASR